MAEAPDNRKHWPVIILVVVVAVIFLVSLMLYQVPVNEYAVVLRFGKPTTQQITPGLHFRLPWPIDEIWRVDNRIHVFEGKTGEIEEVFTADGKNLLVTMSVAWRVAGTEVENFMKKVGNQEQAEDRLTGLVRSYKHEVLGGYAFGDLVNVDPAKVKITEIEAKLLAQIGANARSIYGIEVTQVAIRHVGLPENVTGKVFERMRAERERVAQHILSEGEARAVEIRAQADKQRVQMIADAQQEATRIRGEGDAQAAASYAAFAEQPDLAVFLRQLDSLRSTLSGKTTLVLDTTKPPFNLFEKDVLQQIQNTPVKPAAAKP